MQFARKILKAVEYFFFPCTKAMEELNELRANSKLALRQSVDRFNKVMCNEMGLCPVELIMRGKRDDR